MGDLEKQKKKKILLPLPHVDFDPTEAGIPYVALLKAGHDVVVATPDGKTAAGDARMVSGMGLGPWRPFLQADARGLAAYQTLVEAPEFQNPISYDDVKSEAFDALLLPGGHAPGMKPYLESERLRKIVLAFFAAEKSVAAICHGVVVLARTQDERGDSVLLGKRVTSLLKSQEMLAWGLTAMWLGSYYRTYPTSVQTEVTSSLAKKEDFETGPLPFARDDEEHLQRGFCVRDGHLLTARWPGDAHLFAQELLLMLREK